MKMIPLIGKKAESLGLVALVDDCDYEELSKYRWCVRKNKNKNTVYARRYYKGKRRSLYIHMHRQIMGVNVPIDHADQNGLNNQRYNLRECTNPENAANSHGHKDRKSKFKGVGKAHSYSGWVARLTHNGRTYCLGTFDTEEMAARQYDYRHIHFNREFSCPNFQDSYMLKKPPQKLFSERSKNKEKYIHKTRYGTYQVLIWLKGMGKSKNIGSFPSLEEAIACRDAALQKNRAESL